MASVGGATGLSTWYYIIEACSQEPGICFQFYFLDYTLVDYLHKHDYTLAPTWLLQCSLKLHHHAVPHLLCYQCSPSSVWSGQRIKQSIPSLSHVQATTSILKTHTSKQTQLCPMIISRGIMRVRTYLSELHCEASEEELLFLSIWGLSNTLKWYLHLLCRHCTW